MRTGQAGRAVGAASLAGAAVGAGYWLCMSPYSQVLGAFPYRGPGDANVIALTFDDGPNDRYTSELADFLGERSIRATFFQVGRAVLRQPEISLRLAKDGHVIGNHGFTHEFTNYLSPGTLARDVARGQRALTKLGIRPALYRPPWLLRIPALSQVLASHNLRPVSGEFCHPLEVFQPNPELIARGALAKARPGSIIIFHDGFDGHAGDRASTVAAVRIVVHCLSAEGFGFVTVDQLLGLPPYQPEPAAA